MKSINETMLESVRTLTTEGKSSKEIALELNITEKTVRNYRAIIKERNPIILKSYMHPSNKTDFNLTGRFIEILEGNPGINNYWLIRGYTSSPVADAVFITSTDTINIPENYNQYEILNINKRDWLDR